MKNSTTRTRGRYRARLLPELITSDDADDNKKMKVGQEDRGPCPS